MSPESNNLRLNEAGPFRNETWTNPRGFGSSQVTEWKSRRATPAWQVTRGSMARCPGYVRPSWCLRAGPGATAFLSSAKARRDPGNTCWPLTFRAKPRWGFSWTNNPDWPPSLPACLFRINFTLVKCENNIDWQRQCLHFQYIVSRFIKLITPN